MRPAHWVPAAAVHAAAAVLLLASVARAELPRWQYGASASYSTGDYGGDDETELLYLPFSVKRYWERGDLSLTVPYVSLSSAGEASVIDGAVVEAAGDGASDASGLGDMILKGRYYALEQSGPWPYVDLVGRIKLPTAGDDLGTGEPDFTVGTEFSRSFGEHCLWLADLGYTWIGEPSGADYDNAVAASVGAGRTLGSSVLLVAYLDGQTAVSADQDDPLSLLLTSEFKLSEAVRFDTMLEFGLTDGAPDFGVTVGLRVRTW